MPLWRKDKRSETELRLNETRHFPNEGYVVPRDDDADEQRYLALAIEAKHLGTFGRSKRATAADRRVMEGPTAADRANIPYVQEAWDWATAAAGRLGLKPGHLRYGVVVDALTRLMAGMLIQERDDVDEQEAMRLAGFDPFWIQAEHNARPSDVDPYIVAAERFMVPPAR